MITAIRTELLKLRTTRLAAGMLAVAAGWTALVAAIEASRAGPGGMVPSLATSAGLRDVLTSTGFALIIAAAYGTTITSSERRHHTITDTYLDDPNRRQVLIAKVITAGLTGLVFGLAGTIVTTGVGLAFAAVTATSSWGPARSSATELVPLPAAACWPPPGQPSEP